ncbi:uncharacterized protein LOC115228599 [Octopus sinensis]|uniref:Uncharacterized protein LOC115228599 n=1 Tax=Octopus sinensis TaxID=2607531 RepID=A0A6P7U207_9MOLL|nr:uncharacterized protein LOC115228599 [Octopus sinensis]
MSESRNFGGLRNYDEDKFRIVISELPSDTIDKDIHDILDGCMIRSIKLVNNPDDGRFTGRAFVNLSSEECLKKALEFDGCTFDERHLKIEQKFSRNREEQQRQYDGGRYQNQGYNQPRRSYKNAYGNYQDQSNTNRKYSNNNRDFPRQFSNAGWRSQKNSYGDNEQRRNFDRYSYGYRRDEVDKDRGYSRFQKGRDQNLCGRFQKGADFGGNFRRGCDISVLEERKKSYGFDVGLVLLELELEKERDRKSVDELGESLERVDLKKGVSNDN